MPETILELPFNTAARFPERVSHRFLLKNTPESRTFAEFTRAIRELTAAFKEAGVERGHRVGFFVNNRFEWSVTDYALQALGAVSVPRGSDTTPKEQAFIFNHSDSSRLILETSHQLWELNELLTAQNWDKCRCIFIMDGSSEDDLPESLKDRVRFYSQLFEQGPRLVEAEPNLVEELRKDISQDDILTIVYTSGTTGNPKGVMLSHKNFLQNVTANTPRLKVNPERNDTTVIMLPSWHVYERAFEFVCHHTGVTIVYSSAGRFAADLIRYKPELIISVPRVWESVYQKMIKAISQMGRLKRNLIFMYIKINQVYLSALHYIRGGYISLRCRGPLRKTLRNLRHIFFLVTLFPGHRIAHLLFKPFREKVGGNLRIATSGAGSLPKYLDEVFNALGIPIVNAYGMTECAPGILSRTIDVNTFGSTGIPFDNTDVEIRRENGTPAHIGEKGVLFVRGPQVMAGYYKNPQATEAVLDARGWLNTGDLAVRSENGEIIIVGRMKDTIVLMGGENVEPEPIEDKMKESLYIDHAVVLGQDQKQLSAIVAVNEEELMNLAQELKVSPSELMTEGLDSIEHDRIYQHLMDEVNSLISREHGFRPFEAISRILPVRNDFSIGKELTQTLKVKRLYIQEKYKGLISRLNRDSKNK